MNFNLVKRTIIHMMFKISWHFIIFGLIAAFLENRDVVFCQKEVGPILKSLYPLRIIRTSTEDTKHRITDICNGVFRSYAKTYFSTLS